MKNRQLYNEWSATYDVVENKTRDLEEIAGREILSDIQFETVIELGCGTGKNTVWLAERAKQILAVDQSEDMQAVARKKVRDEQVKFELADISKPWNFTSEKADLMTCSLILEHLPDLDFIFKQARQYLKDDGYFYVCELHSFKQYAGGKARFEINGGMQVLDCFTHHISDYTKAAVENGFSIFRLDEWFDDNDRTTTPRLISFLFRADK